MTTQEEVTELREQNEHLEQAIKRYRSIVENFEEEYAAVSKYVEKKAKWSEEGRHGKETKVVYLDKSRGSGVGPKAHVTDSEKHRASPYSKEEKSFTNPKTDGTGARKEDAKPPSNNQAPTITPSRLGEKLGSKEFPDRSRLSMASSALPNEKVELKLVRKLLESFTYCLKGEKALELVVQSLDILKQTLGCQKATLYPLDFYMVKLTTQGQGRERQKSVHQVEFLDASDNSSVRLAAICKDESELCKTVLFPSLQKLEDDILISEDGTKFAILMRQCKRRGGPSFILQAEFD